jgi:hypothetical protein
VEVDVVDHAGACYAPEVPTQVVAVRAVLAAERRHGRGREAMDGERLVV